MSFRIAVDTGGTFSDVVLTDDAGRLWVDKAPTTPDRMFRGISAALEHAASERDITLAQLLRETSVFVYGTTHSTNAIVTSRTAKTAFLTTSGFPDVLVLREGGKVNPFDFRKSYPGPYIPKSLTFEIPERVMADGTVRVALDEDKTRAVLRGLRELDVEAVAVSLLWSIVNPVHEERLGTMIEEELPGVRFTLSHQLNPIVREYRRASSASIDASLKPLMQSHLREIEEDLKAGGFAGELLIVSSFGGVLDVEDVASRPIYSVNSGPSMAPVAGRHYAGDVPNVIVCDMGGTTFDVSVVRDGYIKFTRETWLGAPFVGHMTGLSSVDVKSIGAGGGSIAWIDAGGLLRVGPQSAGAVPGPVCYGQGGEQPTVTDAALVLGHLDPAYFLGGRIRLDAVAARAAIAEKIAEPLGQSVEEAAWSILVVANEHMVTAIREITINEGLDPRDSVIVAGGGAGGMTIAQIAQTLGCDKVLVPRTAGALSACGGQFSDIVTEFTVSARSDTNRFDHDGVNEALAELDAKMDVFFDRLAVEPERRHKEFFVEARYPYQVWELEVALDRSRFNDDEDLTALTDEFHRVHDRVFAVKDPDQYVECIYWKGRATAEIPKPAPAQFTASAETTTRRTRMCHFGEGEVETACYLAGELAPGDRVVQGPAIVEEPTTTVVVHPGWNLGVTDTGDYLMTKEDA
jgi:N-methylhydantoinase A